MCLCKPTDCTTPKVNCNVNDGFGVIILYQYRFITCNRGSTLVGAFDKEGGYAVWGVDSIWEIYYFLVNFAVNL